MDLKSRIGKELESAEAGPAGTEWFVLSTQWLGKYMTEAASGPIDNADLLVEDNYLKSPDDSYLNSPLKSGLQLHKDYELVSAAAWEPLVGEKGVEAGSTIKRYSSQVSETETQVEVTLTPLQVVFLPKASPTRELSQGPEVVYFSKQSSIRDIKKRLLDIINDRHRNNRTDDQLIQKDAFARLWKLEVTKNYADLKELEKMQQSGGGQILQFPGEALDEGKNIDEAQVSPSDLIVLEAKDYSNDWRFSQKIPKCKSCNSFIRSKEVRCSCGKAVFCTERCRNQDRHSCEASIDYLPNRRPAPLQGNEPAEALTLSSKGGLTGLQNLGNTCYMNSAIQCLSHTTFLVEFFLSGQYRTHINRRNPIGSGGRIAEAFAGLIADMWSRAERVVAPWDLRQAIGRSSHIFQGYQQHDSQELLSFLLDALHEDFNSITQKPYIEELKLDHLSSEEEKANLVWAAHLSRNRSIIVDNMYGQYRTQLTCPKCKLISHAYDPFSTLTVDLPEKGKLRTIVYVPLDARTRPQEVNVLVYKSGTLDMLKQTLADKLGLAKEQLLLASVRNYEFKGALDQTQRLSEYKKEPIYAFEIHPEEGKTPIVVEMVRKERSMLFFSSESFFSLPRILYVEAGWSLTELHKTAFRLFGPLSGEEGFVESFPGLTARSPDRARDLYILRSRTKTILPFDSKPALEFLRQDKGTAGLGVTLLWQGNGQVAAQANMPVAKPERLAVGKTLSLAECLVSSCSPKTLDADNAWKCPRCGKVQASKEMTVFRSPRVLIIHLKRFKHSKGYVKKNDSQVAVPRTLDLAPFMTSSPYRSETQYQLYAMSLHSGGLGGGHYTAYAQAGDRWFSFNDSSVHQVEEATVLQPSAAAYVLCYAKPD